MPNYFRRKFSYNPTEFYDKTYVKYKEINIFR